MLGALLGNSRLRIRSYHCCGSGLTPGPELLNATGTAKIKKGCLLEKVGGLGGEEIVPLHAHHPPFPGQYDYLHQMKMLGRQMGQQT